MTVYISLMADIFHAGHARLISQGCKLGDVTVGLLSDNACSELGETPLLDFEKRKEVLSYIKGIEKIIKQDSASYLTVLSKVKPDYVLHGDDWRKGPQSKIRSKVIKIL